MKFYQHLCELNVSVSSEHILKGKVKTFVFHTWVSRTFPNWRGKWNSTKRFIRFHILKYIITSLFVFPNWWGVYCNYCFWTGGNYLSKMMTDCCYQLAKVNFEHFASFCGFLERSLSIFHCLILVKLANVIDLHISSRV